MTAFFQLHVERSGRFPTLRRIQVSYHMVSLRVRPQQNICLKYKCFCKYLYVRTLLVLASSVPAFFIRHLAVLF